MTRAGTDLGHRVSHRRAGLSGSLLRRHLSGLASLASTVTPGRTLSTLAAALLLSGALAAQAFAADTASCEGKRVWQRDIVEEAIRNWLDRTAQPESLLELIQAEQGIAACGQGNTVRLHTTRLPLNLVPSQLGAVLLANELEWRGLMPAPEDELAGKFFRSVSPRNAAGAPGARSAPAARGPAQQRPTPPADPGRNPTTNPGPASPDSMPRR